MSAIKWVCDQCQQQVYSAEGMVLVLRSDIAEARRAILEWESARNAESSSWEPIDLLNLPGEAAWRVRHYGCMVDLASEAYGHDVGDLGSHREVLRYTLHMMDKRWFRFTNWSDAVRSIAGVEW